MYPEPGALRQGHRLRSKRQRATDLEQRRILVTASAEVRLWLQEHFQRGLFRAWEMLEADTLERAHFLLQHDVFDVHLVDESVGLKTFEGLRWVAGRLDAPVVLLAGPDPEVVTDALASGVDQWLPRDLALQHPALLLAALDQAAGDAELRRHAATAGAALTESHRHVSRLLDLLWESVPLDARAPWFTQRCMLERLQEEVNRTQRYGSMMSVVLGEVRCDPASIAAGGPNSLVPWIAQRLLRAKRRSDVVGQYGPDGFMLLLVQTPEPGAAICCQRLRAILEQGPAPFPGPRHAHFGIATYSPASATPKSLLSRAEERLEQALATTSVGTS